MKFNVRSGLYYAQADIIAWIKDARTITALILTCVFLHSNISGIIPYASIYNLEIAPCFFPFITSTRIIRLFLYLVLLFLVCDVGAPKPIDLFVRLRMRPSEVQFANLLLLFWRVVIFWTTIALFPILVFFPHIEWTLRWGKIWGNLARVADYKALGDYAIRVSDKIVDGYEPATASLISFIFCVMSGYFMGVLILISKKIQMDVL